MKLLLFFLLASVATFGKGMINLLLMELTTPYEELFFFKMITAIGLCGAIFFSYLIMLKKNKRQSKEN